MIKSLPFTRREFLILAILIVLTLIFGGCSNQHAASSPAPIPTGTWTPTSPQTATSTGTATIQPTDTPTITPTPLPEIISEDNVSLIKPYARIGSGLVNQISLSPDGSIFAFATSIGIRLVEAETFNEISFIETENRIVSIAFSPDAESLFSGSADIRYFSGYRGFGFFSTTSNEYEGDNRIQYWDINSGNLIRGFGDQVNNIEHLAISSDGLLLFSASRCFGETKLYNVIAKAEIWSTDPGTICGPVALSPDGKSFVYAGFDGLELRRVVNGEILHRRLDIKHASSLAFNPDGSTLAIGDRDGLITLLDGHSLEIESTLTGHTGRVTTLIFLPDGTSLLSGSHYSDGTVRLWDVIAGIEKASLDGFSYDIILLIPIPNDDGIYIGTRDGSIFRTSRVLVDLEQLFSQTIVLPNQILFSPTGELLASADDDGIIRLWDSNTLELVRELTGHTWPVVDIDFGPNGSILASAGGRDGTVMVWDVATSQQLHSINAHRDITSFEGYTSSVDFSPDGQVIASSGSDSRIRLWNVTTGEKTYEIYVGGPVRNVSFSPDGKYLATESGTKRRTPRGESINEIKVWYTATGDLKFSFDDNKALISQNGTSLLTGRFVRDLESGNTVQDESPWCDIFSPDGEICAQLYAWSRKVNLFDSTETNFNLPLFSIEQHNANVTSVAFSPDGRIMATASNDGTIILWRVEGP